MTHKVFAFGFALLLAASANAAPVASPIPPPPAPNNFGGAQPQPIGTVNKTVSQLQIRFPSEMSKASPLNDAIRVSCVPAIKGQANWADNNSLWTYDFQAADEYSSPALVGGAKCTIEQTADVTAVSGTVFKAGTLNYSVVIAGPNVDRVTPAQGFNGSLREKDPVVMIQFDGPVDRAKFFADQDGIISYTSPNAPAEKIALTEVPADQAKELFTYFKRTNYMSEDFTDTTWILATVKQNLVPGAQVNLTIQNQASAVNPGVQSSLKYAKEFQVRGDFQPEVKCAQPSAKTGNCLPKSAISIELNGKVKWADIKDAYIEYVPYKSADGKIVRDYAQLIQDPNASFFDTYLSMDSLLNMISRIFPFMAKYSDTVVDSVTFNVDIEPQTQAKVVIPTGLTDIDGRVMTNAVAEFHVRIGSMSEMIQTPQTISIFEKNVPNLTLPVGVVNLNQKLSIRKTGASAAQWDALTDPGQIINVIRAYAASGRRRSSPAYTSPLDQTKVASTVVDQQLTGQKNRPTVLQFPFADAKKTPKSGFYAIEVSSPSFEAEHSDAKENSYLNPKYVLAQVTDLAIHLKKGQNRTVAWVTSLSKAEPVAGATVEIYNCVGQKLKTVTTDASGLAGFDNVAAAASCNQPKDSTSGYEYFQEANFYAVARTATDFSLIHSSWNSSSGYAFSAPGVDYFSTDIVENSPHFHSVIGVNLVKPGQTVPVEIFAKLPVEKGFTEVDANRLPSTARVVSADDENTFFEFPLTWKNGTATLKWAVPSDASVKLGQYTIKLMGAKSGDDYSVTSSDIEVAEFKIPLMSGLLAFPNRPLVQPDSIPVNTVIRYANGVGAKQLPVDVSYYFSPTSVSAKDFADFSFGSGALTAAKVAGDDTATNTDLPSNARPATLAQAKTGTDGSVNSEIATQPTADGRTVAEVLKTLDRPQHLVVRARYQDQMGEYQTLSQGKDIFNASEYVGTTIVSGERAKAKLRAVVIDANQKSVTDLANLKLEVIRVETKVIGEELFGGLIKNTLERELKPVRWTETCAVDAAQTVSCPVGALKAGNYAFQVTANASKQVSYTLFKVDSNGRVYGSNDYNGFGDGDAGKNLPLALNKKKYRTGDNAVVSFSSPFKSCRALVTIERSDVMKTFIVPNACEKGFVEIPVDATMVPNAFVSVYAITGRADSVTPALGEIDLGRPTYRLGYANVKVGWDQYKANVEVKTDKDVYEPGQMVNVSVGVHPAQGSLKGATVTLVAIEEKILELKPNDTFKILEAFMQLREDGVQLITPLERVETVTSATNPDSARKGGDEGGDGSSKQDFKRRLFDALVSFQPDVPVVNGVAKFSFKANDSLTRFKIFAVSTDASQKFGTGEATYLSAKDTQTYSNIPSVAHTGDSFPVKVTVQNNGADAAKYRAEVVATVKDASGKVLATNKLSKEVTIDKATSTAIDVGQMTIDEKANTIEYAVTIYDEKGKVVDGLEQAPQKVLASVPLATHDSFIEQVVAGTLTRPLSKETGALPDQGDVRISMSNSLVNSAVAQIQIRVGSNLFVDFFTESRFDNALLKGSAANSTDLQGVLASLVNGTDSEGFVKTYPQATRGSVYLTASILNSLQLEPWALKLLPQALATKMKGAVSEVLTKSVDPVYIGGKSEMAWLRAQMVMGRAAFAFADPNLQSSAKAVLKTAQVQLQRNPAFFGETTDKWSADDLLDLWLLEVYASPATAQASDIYKQLIAPARLVYQGNASQLQGSPRYGWYYTDETADSAKLLLGHSLLKMDKNVARALGVGLVNANTQRWYGTSTMTAVAQGLKAFGRAYESDVVSGSSQVTLVETAKSMTVDWTKVATSAFTSPFPSDKLTVKVDHAGQGQPWVGVEARTAVPLTAARGQGIAIDKSVRNLNRASGYQAGDIIEVTLKINVVGALQSIAMNDPIPAGSNIVADAYGDFSSGEKSYSGYKMYFEYLPVGLTTVKYSYQLNNPGTFNLPPTRAEGLYMPSVFGEFPNAAITVN